MLPSLPRQPDIKFLIDNKYYFLLHAPRQSGKTTIMRAAVDSLNEEGKNHALYCDLEHLSDIQDETIGMRKILASLDGALADSTVKALKKAKNDGFWLGSQDTFRFKYLPLLIYLKELCRALDKQLVIFFDEADCLEGRVLISFLAQLRSGYMERFEVPFPLSVALIGMRDLQDYKTKVRPESDPIDHGSPFNIIRKSLTLHNFGFSQIQGLYAQHTEATGQVFLDEAVQRSWFWSEGQPWLVNALASVVVEEILQGDYKTDVTSEHIDIAAASIMSERDMHISSLLKHLSDPRVKRIILSMLSGSDELFRQGHTIWDGISLCDDQRYCVDIGLIKIIDGKPQPANPIYHTVIARHLSRTYLKSIPPD
jgi:hypothetical protein